MQQEYIINRLGRKGEGVAVTDRGILYIPYTLPYERVLAEQEEKAGSSNKKADSAKLISVLAPSPHRIEPLCPLFTQCGGCSMQHAAHQTYSEWKRKLVEEQLQRAGISFPVHPLIDAHGNGRRRVTFHARFSNKTVVGFMAAGSHNLIEIPFCPVLEPELKNAPNIARDIAEIFSKSAKTLDILISNSQSGYDVDIRGIGYLSDKLRLELTELCTTLDLARLSNHGDVIVERRAPVILMGDSAVVPAPGAFLQATHLGEQVIAEHVVSITKGCKRVADLFSGCGPFTLRLAHHAEVHAVEMETVMLQALNRAARMTSHLRRVTVEQRDLFRRPLLIPELDKFDAVVLDPPRAGAEAQCQQLAKSHVPKVILVSCNAATFARDTALLMSGGYYCRSILPIDQFLYSHHVEIIGFFEKPLQKKSKKRI